MSLEKKYLKYREEKLSGLWICYKDIKPLIEKLPKELYEKEIIGYSENKLPIPSLKIGTGNIRILLWSQMHGDESTATKSLFDLFNFITKEHKSNEEVQNLLDKCSLWFIPMLNPDGAKRYTRENAMGIDLNRDAQNLQSVEAQLLWNTTKALQPHYAFNLHDQLDFYTVGQTDRLASFSFLAPVTDETQRLTQNRREAMELIVVMYKALQKYLPGQIGRYDDSFNPNCFGDTFQARKITTILIESGYYRGDEAREITRKHHFIALITGLYAIANGNRKNSSLYFEIPPNEKRFYDLRCDNINYKGKNTSIGIIYKRVLKNGKLVKIIDISEIITGEELKGKIFRKTINGGGKKYSDMLKFDRFF